MWFLGLYCERTQKKKINHTHRLPLLGGGGGDYNYARTRERIIFRVSDYLRISNRRNAAAN